MNPLQLARRIAAALNAPHGDTPADFGFFWMTAVTTDDAIVLANSYGLAYIPQHVQLPDQVHMASADQTIPATERARWATHPVLALQSWAAHHDTKLRAVIATKEQLAKSDPGVAKIALEADDIPANGRMTGRSRLAVVDPAAAARLAATPNSALINLLAPAPTSTQPPTDKHHKLWLEVIKPMFYTGAAHQAAHLRALHSYAAHAQQIAHQQAHATRHPAAQRAAIADWLYWKHLNELLTAALPQTQ